MSSHKIRNNERDEETKKGIKHDRIKKRKKDEFVVKDEEIRRSEETRPFTVRERREKETRRLDRVKSTAYTTLDCEGGRRWNGMTLARRAMTP